MRINTGTTLKPPLVIILDKEKNMSWYNHDWYYTQPPEPESEEEHEEDIYWAERAAKEKREAQDD